MVRGENLSRGTACFLYVAFCIHPVERGDVPLTITFYSKSHLLCTPNYIFWSGMLIQLAICVEHHPF